MKEAIQKLLKDRYFLSTETTWEDIAIRVGKLYEPITQDIIDMNFIPSSPTLMNANTKGERIGTLSSCFPMGIEEDSLEGIFDSIKECALVTKAGGGVGIDASVLRGSCEGIKTAGGRKSSGPLPFINIYNSVLDGVMQGSSRRGAGLVMLSEDHPDILKFIKAKSDITQYVRFNFSVRISDDFYKKLKTNPNSPHYVTRVTDGEKIELKDDLGKVVTTKRLWDILIEQTHSVSEPGLFNKDIATDQCTVTNVTRHVMCNPCAEYISIPYTSCNLGSINLTKIITSSGNVDWAKLEDLIIKGTTYLNNVIDNNKFPIKKIKDITLATRPIGLGVMGLAHMLFIMELPYNSEEAMKLAGDLTRYITLRSMQVSVDLAKEHGKYDAFDLETFMNANKRFFTKKKCREIDIEQLKEDIKKYGCRNSSNTSYAPTGTIGTIAGVSTGIEPVFALSYARKVEKLDKQYDMMYITDPIFKKYLDENFEQKEIDRILKEVADDKGSCQKVKELSKEIRKVFVVAGDLTPMEHLNMLGYIAPNVSLGVSKTINAPFDVSKEDISKVYLEAHEQGIIGVTFYREGSREGILVHNNGNGIVEREAPKRPDSLPCKVHRVKFKGQKWISFVGLCKGKPYEIFCGAIDEVNLPKSIDDGFITKQKTKHYSFYYDEEMLISNIGKSFNNEEHDAFARTISMSLRHGVPLEYIIGTLNKAEGDLTHFSKVLARILKDYIEDGTSGGKCPECGEKLIYIGGCLECPCKCGYAPKCG